MFPKLVAQMRGALGGGENESEVIGMDMMGFMMDMSLLGNLHFQESVLTMLPEALVDELLRQAHEAEK